MHIFFRSSIQLKNFSPGNRIRSPYLPTPEKQSKRISPHGFSFSNMEKQQQEWDATLGVWKNLKAAAGDSTTDSPNQIDSSLPDPLWIFGYGSLCYSPGSMAFSESIPGFIKGFTRRFWQKSCDHRGTPSNPGLVCTLLNDEEWKTHSDRFPSGVVFGKAYCIPAESRQEILDELDFREKGGYSRIILDVNLQQQDETQPSKTVKALLYTANTQNPNFLENESIRQSVDKQAEIILKSIGPSGKNEDYLMNFYKYLVEVDSVDEYTAALVAAVQRAKNL